MDKECKADLVYSTLPASVPWHRPVAAMSWLVRQTKKDSYKTAALYPGTRIHNCVHEHTVQMYS